MILLIDGVDIAAIVVSGVGSGAVVAALLYSRREVKVLQEQLAFDAIQAHGALIAQRGANDLKLMGYAMSVDRLFVEFPELRPYFYADHELPREEPLRSKVIAAAELIVDLADSVTNMIRHGQLDQSDQKAWAAALASYGCSPAVKLIVTEYEGKGAWREATFDLLRGRIAPSTANA